MKKGGIAKPSIFTTPFEYNEDAAFNAQMNEKKWDDPDVRRESFRVVTDKSNRADGNELAALGFLYVGKLHLVQCYYCRMMFAPNLNKVFGEHKEKSSKCHFEMAEALEEEKNIAPCQSIMLGNPKYPEYLGFFARYHSFSQKDRPWSLMTKDEMAHAGFFEKDKPGEGHCFYCGIIVNTLGFGASAWAVHAENNPLCPFLLYHQKPVYALTNGNMEKTKQQMERGTIPMDKSLLWVLDLMEQKRPLKPLYFRGLYKHMETTNSRCFTSAVLHEWGIYPWAEDFIYDAVDKKLFPLVSDMVKALTAEILKRKEEFKCCLVCFKPFTPIEPAPCSHDCQCTDCNKYEIPCVVCEALQ